MFCPYCRALNKDDAAFCTACRASLPAMPGGAQPPSAASGGWATPYRDNDVMPSRPRYAGFWIRWLALWLDTIFAVALSVVPALLAVLLFRAIARSSQETAATARERVVFHHNVFLSGLSAGLITAFAIVVIYQVVMTARGGGWGMQIVGIRIIRADNGRVPGIGKAIGRVVIRNSFGIIPVVGSIASLADNLWLIFDEDKQTWHDKAAGTYVIRRSP